MTHEEARSLMWEDDLTQDFHSHIEGCDECRAEYEKIRRIKEALAEKDNISSAVMAKIRSSKRRAFLYRVLPVACALVVIASSAVFIKSHSGKKENLAADSTEEISVTLSNTSAGSTSIGTTDGSDGKTSDLSTIPEEPMEAPEKNDSPIDPSSPEEIKDEPPAEIEHDLYMLLSVYKDSMMLSYHTSDIIVMGSDMGAALEALTSLGATAIEKHIEIEGDAYFEAQQALQDAGFEIVLVSSSESISKTLIFFSDYLI